MHSESVVVTRREAADSLRVSLRTLDALLASQRIQATRIGRRVLIRRSELERLLGDQALRSSGAK
jgi:excisionase family DNA binding protein